jgi:hypothetical protein
MTKQYFDVSVWRRTGSDCCVQEEAYSTFASKRAAQKCFMQKASFWLAGVLGKAPLNCPLDLMDTPLPSARQPSHFLFSSLLPPKPFSNRERGRIRTH